MLTHCHQKESLKVGMVLCSKQQGNVTKSHIKDGFDKFCKTYALKNADYFGVERQKNYGHVFIAYFLSES